MTRERFIFGKTAPGQKKRREKTLKSHIFNGSRAAKKQIEIVQA